MHIPNEGLGLLIIGISLIALGGLLQFLLTGTCR